MHKLILNTVKPRFTAGFGEAKTWRKSAIGVCSKLRFWFFGVQNFAKSVGKAFTHKGDISDSLTIVFGTLISNDEVVRCLLP